MFKFRFNGYELTEHQSWLLLREVEKYVKLGENKQTEMRNYLNNHSLEIYEHALIFRNTNHNGIHFAVYLDKRRDGNETVTRNY